MNSFERKTLDYLLKLQSEEEWQAWSKNQEPEDFLRALDIIRRAQAENEVTLMELRENQGELDLTDAQQVLSRY